METFLVPADVRALLDGGAFRVAGAAGPDGTGWLASATDGSGRRIEVHVVATVLDDVTAARAERLRRLRHEHLPVVHDVVEIGPGRTALVVEHVPGPTLAELRSQRAPLSDGEAATVAIPVATALGALHDAGLAHGGVSPATVVVRPDGRPALVDVRGALTGTGTPDGDVRRLVASVLAQVPDADVHLLAGPHDGSLRDTLEALVTAGDVTAGQLVDRCFAVVVPEPVRLPDAGARAALDLARTGASAAADLRRPRRPARRVPRAVTVAGAAAGTLVAVVLVLGLAGLLPPTGGDGPAAASPAGGATSSSLPTTGTAAGAGEASLTSDVAAAAADLTRLRAELVAAGDATRLGEVEVVDGPAYRADLALVEALAGARIEGLGVVVQDVTVVGSTGTPGPSAPDPSAPDPSAGAEVAVRVTSAMSGYTRVEVAGTTTEVPAADPRTVVLTLRRTDDGWRVWDVADA